MTLFNYALIGKKLEHSFSSSFFTKKFEHLNLDSHRYFNLEMEDVSNIRTVVEKENIKGFNVTIPFKETIIPQLDELDDTAKEIGAVNTVKVKREAGKIFLKGYNTDAYGFHQLIKPFFKSRHERALILGTGGASKAVAYLLQKQYGVQVLFVSRKATQGNVLNWNDLNDNVIRFYKLIVNTTPVGMHPLKDEKPNVPMNEITKEHLVIDLIYNPEETLFLKDAKKRGAVVLNGLTMLHQQAEKAWEIWNK